MRQVWLVPALVLAGALACAERSPVDVVRSPEAPAAAAALLDAAAAVQDAATRLVAPLAAEPGAAALSAALDDLVSALQTADDTAVRLALAACENALASLAEARPAAEQDLPAVALALDLAGASLQ